MTFTSASRTFTTVNWATQQRFGETADYGADRRGESVTITHRISGAGYGSIPVRITSVTVAADEMTVPGAPRNLNAQPGHGEVRLSWDPPAADGGHSITDYQYRVGSDWWISIGGTSIRHTVPNLTKDTNYQFRVRGRTTLGIGTEAGPVGSPAELARPQQLPGAQWHPHELGLRDH